MLPDSALYLKLLVCLLVRSLVKRYKEIRVQRNLQTHTSLVLW